MNRLLYFTGYRMVAQEWNGSDLKNSVFFEPDEQGFELFKTYLQSINQEPIRLLVDLIEEEFRQATIPLVRGPDRTALIKRHLEKFFRHSKFRHAFTQSIEKKKNRKEENLIFTGLTNPELIEPWLAVIEKTKTPLAGIISLPIISERFVEQLENKTKCVILVSQQVPSNLRQTVFLDGKLVLSRLVPIASFYQGKYAEDVVRDIDSTQRYLVSQRIIERADTITVHILSSNRHFDKLKIACAESHYLDYEIHNINELLKARAIDLYDEQDFSSALFCHESTKIRFVNHYARKQDKRYLKHYFVGLSLKFMGIAIFVIGLGLGVSNAVQGYLYQNSIAEMTGLKNQYDIQYKRLEEKSKSLPASTKDMKLAVEVANVINENYNNTPEKLMVKLSQDLRLFADLRLTGLDWFIADLNTRNRANEVRWGTSKKRKRGRRDNRRAVNKSNFKGHHEILIFDGEFINFKGNYRYALSVLSDFENLLKESGKYDLVEVLVKPLNIGGEASLVGNVTKKDKQTAFEAKFKIKVTTKVPLNV